MQGKLYLCATPIGNLEDMTFRAVRTLREADLIAAEDTRNSIKLLNHFDIKTPMTSYHEYNRIEKARYLVEQMREGKNVALITDAGTPGISDLEELKTETRTVILYEAPHRLVRTLEELLENLGDRRITLCRELTKKHETVFLSTLSGALEYYRDQEPKGECVIVMEGRSREEMREEERRSWEEMDIREHMDLYLSRGMDQKAAMKAVAKDRRIGKRDVYRMVLEGKES